ncbi:hypothetical protein CBF45_09380 [Bordetella sp. J329]|nr:hypothetical protein CBF45_09380 [Bordetella sp. J329]
MSVILRGRVLAAAAVLASLGACSILPEPVVRTPYVLPMSQVQANAQLPQAGWNVRVVTPQAVRSLDSRQWWIVAPDASVSVYKDVLWAEPAPVMVRERLITAFIDARRFSGVSNELSGLPADFELESSLRAFQVLRKVDGGGTVYLRLDADLLHLDSRRVVADQVFEERVDVPDLGTETVVQAYGRATDALAADVLAWAIEAGNKNWQSPSTRVEPMLLRRLPAQQ